MEPFNANKWIAIGAACVMLFGIFYAQHAQISSLKKERDELIIKWQKDEDALSYIGQQIVNNAQDQNKSNALPIVLHEVQVKYRNQVIYSDRLQDAIKEDKNESAIDSVIKFGSSIDYGVQQ